jgi:hypothetical protein
LVHGTACKRGKKESSRRGKWAKNIKKMEMEIEENILQSIPVQLN